MKKILIVLMIATGFFPCLSMGQDAGTLKAVLPAGFTVISVNQESTPLSAKVRSPEGKIVIVYLIKGRDGKWVASSNPNFYRAPGDIFIQSEQQGEAQIKADQERMHKKYEGQRKEQNIADDVADDL